MNLQKDSRKKTFLNGVLISAKITLIFALFFILINQNFSLKGIGYTLIISAMYSFGLGFSQALLNEYLSKKWDWIANTNERIWAGIIGTVIYTVPAVLGINYINFIVISGNDPDRFFKGNFFWVHVFYVIISFGVSAFLHARSFMLQWKSSVEQESTKQEIVAKTETARFESLKNQLDPHFLFNSLNVLTSLIGENPHQAERFTTKLSKVYRYVLEQRNKDLVPIIEELNFAKVYMQLLGMRFEDAVKFNIPDTVSDNDLKIVPLSLQLLLENAVKHNVVSSYRPLTISIFEENHYLIIENNVNPKQAIGKSTKVGLQNIADRYGLITDKVVKIENNNKSFKVCLPLLYQLDSKMFPVDEENNKYLKALERVVKLKEFYQNLISYCIVIPFLIFLNLRFSPGFYWFWFVIFGWGMGIAFHFLEVNNYNIFLGKNWEDRKVKEMMKADKNYK
jgi:hypothetical protein